MRRSDDSDEQQGWVAVQYVPDGDPTIVKRGKTWPVGYQIAGELVSRMVADLGLEGWEPMPIVEVSGYDGSSHSTVRWLFKRQLPDAT